MSFGLSNQLVMIFFPIFFVYKDWLALVDSRILSRHHSSCFFSSRESTTATQRGRKGVSWL